MGGGRWPVGVAGAMFGNMLQKIDAIAVFPSIVAAAAHTRSIYCYKLASKTQGG